MGIPVDFVTAEEELDGYDLVLAPMLMMVSDEGKKNIESYAQAGGKNSVLIQKWNQRYVQ